MPKKKTQKWSMSPKLHNQVSEVLETENLDFKFHVVDEDTGAVNNWNTSIVGRFRCYNSSCKTVGWSSGKIATTIRMYSGNRYNARVYSQRCRACNFCSRPVLDEQCYVERVTYRLKVWKGVKVQKPANLHKNTPEHEFSLCEGCKVGQCVQGGSRPQGLGQRDGTGKRGGDRRGLRRGT